jgi:transcriptional antiterminator NusG
MADENMTPEGKWYVVHTYSGYENKVKADIEKTRVNRHLEDQILDVWEPTQSVIGDKVDKNGKQKELSRKILPGYVLIKMVRDDKWNDVWYVGRNTRGVTGFVGPDSKPVALTEAEVANMMRMEKQTEYESSFHKGDEVAIINGSWKNQGTGIVESVDSEKKTLTINVELFNRSTLVEVGFDDVELKTD